MINVMNHYYQYLLQPNMMILNKQVVTSLLPFSVQKQTHPTPRLLNQTKKINSKAHQMQRFEVKPKQLFNFDDSVCFNQAHKAPSKNQQSSKVQNTKKCISQILTIKHVYQNPAQLKDGYQEPRFQLSNFKAFDSRRHQWWFYENSQDYDLQKAKISRTSQSMRKYSLNKQSQEYNQPIQRPLTQQKSIRKKSTFAKSKFPYSIDRLSNTLKISNLDNSCQKSNQIIQANEKEDAKQLTKTKISNFFQYSIIKSDGVKRISLKKKEQESRNYIHIKRKKQYNMIYQQMLQQMKWKEANMKKNRMMRELILKEGRSKALYHTCCLKRNNQFSQQKNELKPWEVEGNNQRLSNFDIV